jgi:hypothetical protein
VYNVFFNASGWTGCIGFQRERGIGRFFMNMNYIFCCIKIFFTRTIWYYVLQNEIFLFFECIEIKILVFR